LFGRIFRAESVSTSAENAQGTRWSSPKRDVTIPAVLPLGMMR